MVVCLTKYNSTVLTY